MHAGRPPLWAARIPGQVFTVEQHAEPISDGPGLVFSALIPDMHHFNNRGGRTLPLLYPDGTPNLAPGLLAALSAHLGRDVTAQALLAYVAGVAAHPAHTRTFADELTTPGIRVPLTTDPALWVEAVALGEQVLWLHTYGAAFAGGHHPGRPAGSVRYPRGDVRQPLSRTPITAMPEAMTYDADRAVVAVGTGELGPVPREVWDYAVGGKKSSLLDYLHVDAWDPDWTTELVDLLTVLARLVELEPAQADLLARVVAGPVRTVEGLRAAGVRWPSAAADRKPRYPLAAASGSQATLDIG